LKQGKKVLIFPEGTRSRDGGLGAAEAGVGLFIAKSLAPVLPVRLVGTYEAFPRGARCLHPSKVTLVVGDIWHPDLKSYTETGKVLYQALADHIMHQIDHLKGGNGTHFGTENLGITREMLTSRHKLGGVVRRSIRPLPLQ
jgi:1-acyl-sn-glycerol-3-phosphate acyltransferase